MLFWFPCSKNDTGVRLRISMPCARNCEPTASCVVISTIVHCHQSMAISRLVKDQLIADSSDFFNRKLKYPLYVFVTGYVVFFLINRTVFNVFEGSPAVANSTEDGQVHVAADSGLLMNLRNFRNREFYTYQRLHSSFAVGAFVMVLFQKFTVSKMAFYASAKKYTKAARNRFYDGFLQYHKFFGKLCVASVFIMDICGLFVGKFSAWKNFQTFNLYFFLPWIFMIIGIYGTARSSTMHLHRFFGNMLLKGCIATPFARIAGSMMQRLGFKNSTGYYVGIGTVTAIISCWQLIDTYYLFQHYTTFRMQYSYDTLSRLC